MADFLNSKSGGGSGISGGAGVWGQLSPVRANVFLDYYLPPYPGEVTGSELCEWEIVDWPLAADDFGMAFDQANIYGVRQFCCRRPLADGGGDEYTAVYPVPKTLPSGYTHHDRRKFFYDPLNLFLRTPTNNAPHKSALVQGLSAHWWAIGPMATTDSALFGLYLNYDNRIEGGAVFTGTVVAGPYTGAVVGALDFGVGWRAAKLTTVTGPSFGGPGGTVTYTIAVDADPLSPWDVVTGANPPTSIATISAPFSAWPAAATTTTTTLGNLYPLTHGVCTQFYLIQEDGFTAGLAQISGGLGWRTDIPLFCDITYKNKIAPGGILT